MSLSIEQLTKQLAFLEVKLLLLPNRKKLIISSVKMRYSDRITKVRRRYMDLISDNNSSYKKVSFLRKEMEEKVKEIESRMEKSVSKIEKMGDSSEVRIKERMKKLTKQLKEKVNGHNKEATEYNRKSQALVKVKDKEEAYKDIHDYKARKPNFKKRPKFKNGSIKVDQFINVKNGKKFKFRWNSKGSIITASVLAALMVSSYVFYKKREEKKLKELEKDLKEAA